MTNDRTQFIFADAVFVQGGKLLTATWDDIICCLDCNSGEIEILNTLPNDRFYRVKNIHKKTGKIYFASFYGRDIFCFDTNSLRVEKFESPEADSYIILNQAVADENSDEIWLVMATTDDDLYSFNTREKTFKKHGVWKENLLKHRIDGKLLSGDPCVFDKKIWTCIDDESTVFSYTLSTGEIRTYELGINHLFCVLPEQNTFWLLSKENKGLYKCDPESLNMSFYPYPESIVNTTNEIPFIRMVNVDSYIVMLPARSKHILVFEKETGSYKAIEDVEKIIPENTQRYGYRLCGENLYLFPFATNDIFKLNLNDMTKCERIKIQIIHEYDRTVANRYLNMHKHSYEGLDGMRLEDFLWMIESSW